MMMFVPLMVGMAYPIQSSGAVTQDPVVGNYTQQVDNSVFYQPFNLVSVFTLFGSNAWTALFIFASGIAVLPSAYLMAFNGFEVGYFIHFLAINVSWPVSLGATLPHGLVELSAFSFCAAAGMKLFYGIALSAKNWIWNYPQLFFSPNKKHSLKADINDASKIFLVGLGLLFIAAVLETFLTPLIMGLI
jgi:uncharacterized membrane protein SpoIIM required for sporulation